MKKHLLINLLFFNILVSGIFRYKIVLSIDNRTNKL